MRKFAKIFSYIIPVISIIAIFVFIYSFVFDVLYDEMEVYEHLARLAGYILIISISIFSELFVLGILKDKTTKFQKRTFWIVVLAILLLVIHDILYFIDYGNSLDGLYPMSIFFILDFLLLVSYLVLIFFQNKCKGFSINILLYIIAILWFFYVIGDCAGYSISNINDWDEALLKIIPMLDALMRAILIKDKK